MTDVRKAGRTATLKDAARLREARSAEDLAAMGPETVMRNDLGPEDPVAAEPLLARPVNGAANEARAVERPVQAALAAAAPVRPAVTPVPLRAAPDVAGGFGPRLAAERERQGMSVGDIAGRLRLHPNQVRALEAGNLAALPSAPYVRGFVRNYARALGVDPQPLVADLVSRLAPPPATLDALTGPTIAAGSVQLSRKPSGVSWADGSDAAARRTVLAVAVLALLLFAGLGWFATHRPSASPQFPGAMSRPPAPVAAPAAPALGDAAAPAATVPSTEPASASGPAAVPGAAPALPVPPNAKLSPQAAAGLISQGTPPPAAAPASAASPPAPSPGTPSASGATSAGAASPSPAASATARPPTAPATTAAGATTLDGLLLRFSELAWVQVTQADGRVLLSQNSPAGSEQAISGLAPLRLTVGNASAVTLTYKGRTVDLRPYSRDNVARLTLE